MRPKVNIERDLSLRCWEINLRGENHFAQVFFYDDGRTEIKQFTREEILGGLADDILAAIGGNYIQA